MVNNRRSEFDIISDILKISRNGARKTELLYQGNFSYTQLQNYLILLVNNNILEEQIVVNGSGRVKIYKNTDKGDNLLSDINKTLEYFK